MKEVIKVAKVGEAGRERVVEVELPAREGGRERVVKVKLPVR